MKSPLLSTLHEREREREDIVGGIEEYTDGLTVGGIEEYTDGLTVGGTDSAPRLQAMAALRRHIYLEEVFIFPTLRTAGS